MIASIPQLLSEIFIAMGLGFIISFPIVLFWFSRKLKKIKKELEEKVKNNEIKLKGGNLQNAEEEIKRAIGTGGRGRIGYGGGRGYREQYRESGRIDPEISNYGNKEYPSRRQGVQIQSSEFDEREQRDNEEDWEDFD